MTGFSETLHAIARTLTHARGAPTVRPAEGTISRGSVHALKPSSRISNHRGLIPTKLRVCVKLTVSALCALCMAIEPAAAQAIPLVRDTEIERMLRSYEEPILHAAGLEPAAVKMYLVQDSSINAFAAEGQNIFVNTGLLQQL